MVLSFVSSETVTFRGLGFGGLRSRGFSASAKEEEEEERMRGIKP